MHGRRIMFYRLLLKKQAVPSITCYCFFLFVFHKKHKRNEITLRIWFLRYECTEENFLEKCRTKTLLFSVYKDCFYRSHPYFNKDPSIEYAQFLVGIRYNNSFGGWYIKDRDRGRDYGKDRDRHKGAGRDQRGSGRYRTPDRRSHSRDKVEDHRKRAGVSRDKKDGQDARNRRRES